MTKLKPNHAETLRICACVLPDFEIITTGYSGNQETSKTIILWPAINKLVINFDTKAVDRAGFLQKIAAIRQIGRLGLRVNEIGWDACYAEFTL